MYLTDQEYNEEVGSLGVPDEEHGEEDGEDGGCYLQVIQQDGDWAAASLAKRAAKVKHQATKQSSIKS